MRAGIYTRISRDDVGDAAGVDRQREDCTRFVERRGWTLAGEYRENDVSASKGLPRPQYEQIIADAIAAKIDVIVVAAVDRLYREPRELEDLIDAVEAHNLHVENVGGMLDLASASGRMVARIFAATGKNEADRIGERVKRQKQQRAEQGIPQGGRHRVLGYTREWKTIEDEAALVRRIFKDSAAGTSGTALAKALNAEGHKTVSGNVWHSTSVLRIVQQPLYMGKRQYQGQIIGDAHKDIERLVSASVWDKANAQRQSRAGGFNTRRYMLSGFLVCGKCLSSMNGKPGMYRCDVKSGGCGRLSIKDVWLDIAVSNAVVQRGEVTEGEDNTAEIEAAVAEVERKIDALRKSHTAGDLDLEDFIPMRNDYREQIKELKAQVRVVDAATNLAENLTDFHNLSLEDKRIQISRHVQHVKVQPVTKMGRKPDLSRIQIHWKDGTVSAPVLEVPTVQDMIKVWNSDR